MAEKKTETKETETAVKKYCVKVTNNPSYCGIGAGGVHFANGKATIVEGSLVGWFKEHKGYEVTEEKM